MLCSLAISILFEDEPKTVVMQVKAAFSGDGS
jgi:hypothetical protein